MGTVADQSEPSYSTEYRIGCPGRSIYWCRTARSDWGNFWNTFGCHHHFGKAVFEANGHRYELSTEVEDRTQVRRRRSPVEVIREMQTSETETP
jgi:hypothetical protein